MPKYSAVRMPSAVTGRQWPALSPAKKIAVLGGGADAMRDPVALVAVRLLPDVLHELQRRLLDRVVRVERADADPHLVPGRERPAVAGVDVARVDPQLEVVAGALGVHLEASRERPVRRLEVVADAEHTTPAEGVDDQRGGHIAAVRAHRLTCTTADLRRLELGQAGLLEELVAELLIVERGEREGQRPAGLADLRGVDEQRVERLPDRRFQAKIAQPLGGGGARRSLPLTDLVPVEDQHARARRAKFARDCQTGERRAADQDVSIRALGKRDAGGSALRGSYRHGPLQYPAANGSHAHPPCHP